MGGERYKMKMYDGTDPDAPPSWWEGWPLTVVAVALSALLWAAQLAPLAKALWGLFN